MNTRRITGVAAGCAIAVATVLGVQSVDDQQGQGEHRPGVVREYQGTGAVQEADTFGTHDEARQVYDWWVKL